MGAAPVSVQGLLRLTPGGAQGTRTVPETQSRECPSPCSISLVPAFWFYFGATLAVFRAHPGSVQREHPSGIRLNSLPASSLSPPLTAMSASGHRAAPVGQCPPRSCLRWALGGQGAVQGGQNLCCAASGVCGFSSRSLGPSQPTFQGLPPPKQAQGPLSPGPLRTRAPPATPSHCPAVSVQGAAGCCLQAEHLLRDLRGQRRSANTKTTCRLCKSVSNVRRFRGSWVYPFTVEVCHKIL